MNGSSQKSRCCALSISISTANALLFPVPVGELDRGIAALPIHLNCQALSSLSLCSMPDRGDDGTRATNAVENDVGSASYNQFANARLGSGTAQVRMISQCFNDGDDPDGEVLPSIRLVQSHVRSNLLQACASQWTPNDLYRHSASSL